MTKKFQKKEIVQVLESSSLFTKNKDPLTGIECFVLTARVAPVQQSFYFTTTSFTSNGRWLWFYCAFPPSPGRYLGVIDLVDDTINWFPETLFREASPLVDLETGEAYWAIGTEIWKRGPRTTDVAALVNAFPNEMIAGRHVKQTVCHLTFSADKTSLNFDAQFGEDCYVGDIPLNGDKVNIWSNMGQRRYNHGQFNPVDSDLQLIAQDNSYHILSGELLRLKNRMWLIRRGESAKPLFADDQVARNHSHEWWSLNGQYVWYVNIKDGTERMDIGTGVQENIWPNGTCHTHSDQHDHYLVGDIETYNWDNGCREKPCRVAFYNIGSGKETDIVRDLAEGPYDRKKYHTDPHPQFCLDDQLICYTTTILDYFTLALVPVDPLIEATR